MRVIETEPIVQTYYDGLEEGKVLARRCPACGHIEFPPYIACNSCGNLDTEWIDITNIRAKVLQVMPPLVVFPELEFKKRHHGYMVIHIQIPNGDPYATSLVNIEAERYEELYENKDKLVVKPVIVQDEDMKLCLWELEEEGKKSLYEVLAEEEAEKEASGVSQEEEPVPELPAEEEENAPQEEISADDEVAKQVIECASLAYEIDESEISLQSDIRMDLSTQSIKMIIMISEIEEALGVTIEITEAANLVTIEDFVRLVKSKLSD
ncbi:MAG: hypothetical protein IKF90_23795 [Parasporobacterium sp.]|nr:hypothetical protein [Parasporobacterium sp.]